MDGANKTSERTGLRYSQSSSAAGTESEQARYSKDTDARETYGLVVTE
jgi:hypothetical protein